MDWSSSSFSQIALRMQWNFVCWRFQSMKWWHYGRFWNRLSSYDWQLFVRELFCQDKHEKTHRACTVSISESSIQLLIIKYKELYGAFLALVEVQQVLSPMILARIIHDNTRCATTNADKAPYNSLSSNYKELYEAFRDTYSASPVCLLMLFL